MKKLLAVLLLTLPCAVQASPYFRLFDLSHPQIGAGFLIAPKTPTATMAVTDVALVTHSVKDGSVVPESWRPFVPPVPWAFQVGFGGSFNGEATIAPGISGNLAPSMAATLLRGVGQSSSGVAQAIKTGLAGTGQGQVRIGVAFAGVATRAGHFQSFKAAFPGNGVGEILGNAARLDVGYSWTF